MKALNLILFLMLGSGLFAQGPFAPALGIMGNEAIHKDSSVFIDWASKCSIERGLMDIKNPSLGYTSVGDSTMGIGKAQSNGVVSLGDGGLAILQFSGKLYDGPGPDFAVFENSFSDYFLELAFVEVSSDGENYFRFPAHSHSDTSTQIGGFGSVEPSMIHNLAGKYPINYGTPFDLAELKDEVGLDIQSISHIKIIDVVGSIDTLVSRDSEGKIINDPYPTPFPSGGFDLDAVGVIHISATSLEESQANKLNFYPNPVLHEINFDKRWVGSEFKVYTLSGALVYQAIVTNSSINLNRLQKGVYYIRFDGEQGSYRSKLIKQ